EDEDFGLEDGAQHVHLGDLNAGVVGILHLLQQLAVIVEESGDAFAQDELAQDADREMRLAGADGADEDQPGLLERILLDEFLCGRERLIALFASGAAEFGMEAIELAVLVAR